VGGAGWAGGVGDGEVSGVSPEGEEDATVVEEVGERLCGPTGEIDGASDIGGGGGLGRSSGRGCE
ncbi:hypothetical protein A2U01_0105925, partial [Trifolium medium]|nr:hypothetical protein [Trifolium medium]